jgi:Kef-type K+ transport system membrane component KefB
VILPTIPLPALLLGSEHGANNIPLAMLVVFGTAKLFAEIFERIKQPGIVGEILAGILIGPSVFNWVQPNDVLTALAELGVIFLAFQVGLEVKASELMKVGGTAVMAAVLGVLVPLVLGWGIMRWYGEPNTESIFVGGAMVATSVGITARVLASKGLLWHRASKVILAAAVIDDVLGLIVLAIVSSIARGSINVVELLLTAVAAIAFTWVVAKWGTRTMETVVPQVQQRLSAGEVQFNVAMVVLFGLALLALYAGVAAIIGAFLAGMALSDSLERRVHDLTHGVSELLVPFFLVGIGLHLDLSVFTHSKTLVLSAIILVAAVLSKVVGCGLGALAMGWRDALRVGVGMAPRGEVGMVVAQIGLGLGVIPARVYAIVVFMAVLTTMVAPPLLSLSFRNVQAAEMVGDTSMNP